MRVRLRYLAATGGAALFALASFVVAPSAQAAITSSPLVNPRSNKCLDVTGSATANGTLVQLWSCANAANQKWTSTTAGELRVTIGGVTKCLDAVGSGTVNGTRVQIWDCTGGANQKWTLNTNGTISGVQSGRCLDVSGNSTADGALVHLWGCKAPSNNNQRWTASGGPVDPGPGPGGPMAAAPYLYQWGSPPSVNTGMSATGVKWVTLAFVRAQGNSCTPAWDGGRPLTGGVDQQVINSIRAAGGDFVPSFGGWSGNKLGPRCGDANQLAGAYQRVIDAYRLKAIDIDIENTDEFENATVRRRILNAMKIVKERNPGITTIITFGTSTSGPSATGQALIREAAQIGANIDIYTIMPFDFGGSNMYANTVSASEGLKNNLKSAFGWSDDTAYRHMGISGMNGLSDQNELTSPQTWTQIRDWAQARHLARLSFWAVNRDRPCPNGGVVAHCSGIAQGNWEFTRITAAYRG